MTMEVEEEATEAQKTETASFAFSPSTDVLHPKPPTQPSKHDHKQYSFEVHTPEGVRVLLLEPSTQKLDPSGRRSSDFASTPLNSNANLTGVTSTSDSAHHASNEGEKPALTETRTEGPLSSPLPPPLDLPPQKVASTSVASPKSTSTASVALDEDDDSLPPPPKLSDIASPRFVIPTREEAESAQAHSSPRENAPKERPKFKIEIVDAVGHSMTPIPENEEDDPLRSYPSTPSSTPRGHVMPSSGPSTPHPISDATSTLNSARSHESNTQSDTVTPTSSRHQAQMHQTAPKPVLDQVELVRGAATSPSLSIASSSTPIKPSQRRMKAHATSHAALLVSQNVNHRQPRRRETILSTTFAESIDFEPLSSLGQQQNMMKEAQNLDFETLPAFVQPPMLASSPYDPQRTERFTFLYKHPMDEVPVEDGTFAESGKYLVDADLRILGPSLNMSFLAPRATLLSDVGISFLPSSITAIDLSTNARLTDEVFPRLPPALLYLDLRSATQISDAGLRELPRTLQHLNLKSAHNVTNDGMDHLPHGLTHLKLSGDSPNFTCDALGKLPRGLKTLKIDHLKKLTKAATIAMPPALTRLDLPSLLSMRDKCVSRLPRALKHLNVHALSSASSASLAQLPTTVQFLDVRGMVFSSDRDVSTLPPSLTNLHVTVTSFKFATGASLANLTVLVLHGTMGEETPLPASLTAFKYDALSPPSSSASLAQLMPAGLKFLEVRGVAWDDAGVQALPQALLWLALDAADLTSQSFPWIPHALEYLRLSSMRLLFSEEGLGNLPKTLKYLHLDPHPHNKILIKLCPRYFADWMGTTELATVGLTLFGAQDTCDHKVVIEDPNLWIAPEKQDTFSHDVEYAADGSVLHALGYLVPIEEMENSTVWRFPKYKKPTKAQKAKRAQLDPWDASGPSMSPFDIHLTYRLVTRRSLIPPPPQRTEDYGASSSTQTNSTSATTKTFVTDIMDADILALPPTITELCAPAATGISKIGIAHLPRALSYLDLRSMSSLTAGTSLSKLVRKRDQLSVINMERNPFKDTSGVSKLPKSLTALDLSSSSSTSSKMANNLVPMLPQSMTFLSLGCEKLSESLPKSLTALFLGKLHKLKASFVAKLPKTLVYADFYSALILEPAAPSAMPTTLRYLNLHCLEEIRESSLAWLPRRLQFLSLAEATTITDKGIEALPRTLTHLDISETTLTCMGISALPSRLTHLSVKISSGCDRLECIAYLPRTLKVLNYGGDLRDSWFDLLPPNLTFLNLPFAYSMTPIFVTKLPAQLIYFSAHSWSRPLVDLPFSCPGLLYLDLYNSDVSNVNFTCLPRPLQYLNSKDTTFRNILAKQLPNYKPTAQRTVIETIFYNGDLDN